MTLISRNALKKSVTAIFSILVILSIMLAIITLIAATEGFAGKEDRIWSFRFKE